MSDVLLISDNNLTLSETNKPLEVLIINTSSGTSPASLTNAFKTVTADYTIDSTTDNTIEVTTQSVTITADSAIGISGQSFRVKNTSTGNITLDSQLSQTFDGDLTWTIIAGDWLDFQSNGTNYIITG